MKTKPFLLATSGTTVDGRTIDAKMLEEAAKAYDPATYGARVNIEHIRGISADPPFQAYGDLLELSTAEVEVSFNGKKEKRLGLYGVFDMLPNAKKLNDAGQKVYPSIEITPDFAGKGHAYVMGVALTDSPASVGTEPMKFNRQLPGTIRAFAQDGGIEAATLELIEDAAPEITHEVGGFFKAVTSLLTTLTPGKPEAKPEAKVELKTETGDVAAFGVLLQGFAQQIDASLTALTTQTNTAIAGMRTELADVKAKMEATPALGQFNRAPATGGSAAILTDC